MRIGWSVVCLCLLFPCGASAVTYSIQDLQIAPAYQWNQPTAINNNSQVVGFWQTPTHDVYAYSWQNGVTTDLGTFGGHFVKALDVNDSGQIVGSAIDGAGVTHAVLWQNGSWSYISDSRFYPVSINNAGQIAGSYGSQAVVWQDGAFQVLPSVSGEYRSSAAAVNGSGQVVGTIWGYDPSAGSWSRACLWDNGSVRFLELLPGATSCNPTVINNSGQVAGSITLADGKIHGFLWQNGAMQDLGYMGGLGLTVTGINASGSVVGYGATPGNTTELGFIWQDGELRSLGAYSTEGRFIRSRACGINDAGEIVGSADVPTSWGAGWYSVKWTPVPEPPAAAALGCGLSLFVLGIRCRRRH